MLEKSKTCSIMEPKFDDIRPYNDEETAAAMRRLAVSPAIYMIEKFLFEDKEQGYLSSLVEEINSVEEYQTKVMSEFVNRIIEQTTSGLTVSGLDHFITSDGSLGKFLLLSTHRDIILDPAFVQITLMKEKMPLTEIAAGDNLISVPSVGDMIRSNRMIKVVRSGNARELYKAATLLSEYIRRQISGNHNSIWLAHRQGRSKDGHDATEQGLIKMLSMSGSGNFVDDFAELNIMPMAVSYEYETCGASKAMQIWQKQREGFYKKKVGEDLVSMIDGIRQFKGRVHIEFCKPLTREELEEADSAGKNERFRALASIIDKKILPAFKLWPSNYIASDLLTGTNTYKKYYTEEQKDAFWEHIEKETLRMPNDAKNILLGIYSAHIL